MPIPVYLFTGFLESGKTTFLQETLADDSFSTGEKTLVLLCEDGEVALDTAAFDAANTMVEQVENESELTAALFAALQKKHAKIDRVIIEYNGTWKLQNLYDALPKGWQLFQIVAFFNAATFESYLNNMRQLTVDKLQDPEVVIFNRCTEATDKALFHRSVRMVNRQAALIFEREDGSIDEDGFAEELPFDRAQSHIELSDEDFALWYLDVQDHLEEYRGKTISYKAYVCQTPRVPKGSFVAGRFAMTCCADDITFIGFITEWKDAAKLEHRTWVTVTAEIDTRTHPIYDGEGPWLKATSIVPTEPPKDELVYFIR